ncbi:spore germination protein GerM [Ruminiclostridium hungatei]|uniref:Spore germination protein GerM n=1 Tax=Ruminiclostridium hungatei TaxID=48256 RepID=A0A1V4SNJ5_RUMHU|nr:GerMN domain-containing protein [Ruminiclostridium hungatei]OPX45414.1 spore germination protein GerM [Ruminiclostridium hungatei]
MRKIFSLILVCAITMTLFAGCGSVDKSSGIDELTPASSVSLGENQAGELKNKTPYKLYFINEQGKLAPETRYIDNTEVSKGESNLATVLVKELISGPAKGSLLQSSIPQETKVHSDVSIKDGIATVDLTKEFIEKHQGGKKNEQLTLYSIVNTLTEIKDIKSVQFKIDGKVRKDFKGSYQLDISFPRSAYLNSDQPEEQDVIKLDGDTAKEKGNINKGTKIENNNEIINKGQQENKINEGKEKNQTSPSIESPAKESPAKESPAKESPAKESPAKESPAKESPAKESPAKESPSKENPTKESPAKDQKTSTDIETDLDPLE